MCLRRTPRTYYEKITLFLIAAVDLTRNYLILDNFKQPFNLIVEYFRIPSFKNGIFIFLLSFVEVLCNASRLICPTISLSNPAYIILNINV